MNQVYIISAVRTPIGKFGGSLSSLKANELGVLSAKDAIRRAGLVPEQIDESIFGCARQAGIGPNIARQIAFNSGVPSSKPAYTINKACGSGLKAIINGYTSIVLGDNELVLAGGVESMSNIPYLLMQARWGYRMGHGEIIDSNHLDGYFCPMADKLMGATAEELAQKYGISRQEQDAYAVESQHRAEAAIKNGKLKDEIVPIELTSKKGITVIDQDEHPRFGTTLDDLKKLKPVFKKDGTITAGSSSGVTDASSSIILAGGNAVKELGLKPLAKIVAYSSAGVDPHDMGIAPVPAVRTLLEKTKLKLSDIDLIELNEAFAAQVLACDRDLKFERAKLNVNGGAIALGHPTGCTGARITTTLVHEMIKRDSRLGLATLCISGGLGLALLIERENK
ncbi:thiolase family protein [bacterium]|nr:MAG: thiolase family protein [bacterium]